MITPILIVVIGVLLYLLARADATPFSRGYAFACTELVSGRMDSGQLENHIAANAAFEPEDAFDAGIRSAISDWHHWLQHKDES